MPLSELAPKIRISIHVPREGDDLMRGATPYLLILFQSTSPVRGTTMRLLRVVAPAMRFQSTSPVRGTTSIPARSRSSGLFQSTSPVRGTTRGKKWADRMLLISIHVPREGDDI